MEKSDTRVEHCDIIVEHSDTTVEQCDSPVENRDITVEQGDITVVLYYSTVENAVTLETLTLCGAL